MIKEINKISEKITRSIKKSISKRNEYILFLTRVLVLFVINIGVIFFFGINKVEKILIKEMFHKKIS